MVPSRVSSLRSKRRASMRATAFRDEVSLVALRYEKTKAASPPVPLPPTRSLPRASSTSRSSLSSSSSPGHSPVVVVAPMPPAEQHPALRCPPAASLADDWKRDSGHAAAAIRDDDEKRGASPSNHGPDTLALSKSASHLVSGRIPTASLGNHDLMAGLSFSKRGSILLDAASSPPPSPTNKGPDIRVLSADMDMESQKVRSLYESGDGFRWEDGARHSFCDRLEPMPEVPFEETGNDYSSSKRCASVYSQNRRDTELAGGLEDWEDVDGADVDRYGFISAPRPTSRVSTPTDLWSAQLSPRRRNVLHKRDPMGFSSNLGGGRIPSRKVSARSLKTQNSEMSAASVRSSRSVLRQAGNLLPGNRNRRWMDEAGDMLTVSPSLQDMMEEAHVDSISDALKRKEWERCEKWRRMAKVLRRSGDDPQGSGFDFDVRSPKLVERTWKGIPDRWRAAAWWSFLDSAARKRPDSASVDELTAAFQSLQARSSPDDVQIDMDVPRTISRHIMFRRRYRGGQRLLFRVLHAVSLYFPDTGYVQGMASLAATLLCYFDEEKCFVMLVRMWRLRGLERLYQPGFGGLMTALAEFEDGWLAPEMVEKLSELGVVTTAYATRWYLTLFNLSMPFAAQLRVWDVFLLLGDDDDDDDDGISGLEMLHATSAALVQALREVLLDADFENAMKALMSWIPIKDEDLLMKVVKAEWKTHRGRKRT
ncbi:TBC domain-containing protein [Ophiocordyceps camponoti-floridani]|uniref:TBC domain-containing protein n=1 Tax=Ophiocordyceps camponoti-floridani TaxID=2030778 RepID=A0A8H4Q3V6_9HYPO|nr:TBC domain-containing protein [Ophiocordyceps camponoti-floridani]